MYNYPAALLFFAVLFAAVTSRPPLNYDVAASTADENAFEFQIPELEALEYGRYIQEVVNELEKDDNLRKLIESDNYTNAEDIAATLALVSHSLRTRLDELKRREVERLISLQRALDSLKGLGKKAKLDVNMLRVAMRHVDTRKMQFNEADLVRLIRQTATDLERLDDYRREQYKRYEMRKTLERLRVYRNQKVPDLQGFGDKPAEIKRPPNQPNVNANQARINYPGRRAHLQTVWKILDGQDGDLNPRTFFAMHDMNNDGYLDINEVNALMSFELNKVYGNGTAQDGERASERDEEMNRMREVFFQQIDANNDALVSEDEFLVWSRSAEFARDDQFWRPLSDAPPSFTSAEFEQFVREEQEKDPKAVPVLDQVAKDVKLNVAAANEAGLVDALIASENLPLPIAAVEKGTNAELNLNQGDRAALVPELKDSVAFVL